MGRLSTWILFGLMLLAVSLHDTRADTPSENECRPYIEKALHDLKVVEAVDDTADSTEEVEVPSTDPASTEDISKEDDASNGVADAASAENESAEGNASSENTNSAEEEVVIEDLVMDEEAEEVEASHDTADDSAENIEAVIVREKRDADNSALDADGSTEDEINSAEASATDDDNEKSEETHETESDEKEAEVEASPDAESSEDNAAEQANGTDSAEDGQDTYAEKKDVSTEQTNDDEVAAEEEEPTTADESEEQKTDVDDVTESDETDNVESHEANETNDDKSIEEDNSVTAEDDKQSEEAETKPAAEEPTDEQEATAEATAEAEVVETVEKVTEEPAAETSNEEEQAADDAQSDEASQSKETEPEVGDEESPEEKTAAAEDSKEDNKEAEAINAEDSKEEANEPKSEEVDSTEATAETGSSESFPEDDLLMEFTIPSNLRDRTHVAELLRLDVESDDKEAAVDKAADVILKDLKRIYENAIKPLEQLYKYRDLSNRHFSDPEIFSKPLVLFMGPWSGGKSTILNYLTDNEYTPNSLRTGAEPSPAYFNILMHGDEPEVLDGTQLAADWTFSGLQKFGEGLEDRLRGQKLPHKLLEKVNIVEIPGILEVRKQVSRLFPFNDACQWFIDRADIIFLVYDPSKLDVGPETEAILDQLKGREYQTRILLNKGDQVKPEELLRVQGALIWNISPLMSSAQPPVMYTTSLWSHPYEVGAPVRLLQAQERAFLRDLRTAIDKRIDNKIASARRFAVRVRNHAKMVDCYLTTYYNHKTLFGNKKNIADNIIEHPQNYHIYEGLSTLTNISRYDLPDPDVYKDFFRLNKLYDFKKLSETCTYFRGCPINKLDVAIAYDLPELGGKYKKLVETALINLDTIDNKKGTS